MNEAQQRFRDPVEVMSGFSEVDIPSGSLRFSVTEGFAGILERLGITLLLTREYEHIVMALTVEKGRFVQSFVTLPHPSGLVVNRKRNVVFIASTRNPNQIWEFRPTSGYLDRVDAPGNGKEESYLMPSRVKYSPGAYYIHELALIDGKLYANSVGQNGIIRVDLTHGSSDELVWWPKCVENTKGKPDTRANYLQLNSIAAGKSIDDSFYTASSSGISRRRPGHLNYAVDKRGVVFSGRTREVYAMGLTRPHSARLDQGRVWVDNSGYGEVGYVENGTFVPFVRLPGWTRGLAIIGRVLFVGVSKVLDRFRQYAPGLKGKTQVCGVYAVDKQTGRILGSIVWPGGNQIFAVDAIDSGVTKGFLHRDSRRTTKSQKDIFYRYLLNSA